MQLIRVRIVDARTCKWMGSGGTFDVRLQTNCNLIDKHKKVHGFVEDPSSNILYFDYEYNTTATSPSNGSVVIDLSNLVNIPSLALGTYYIYSEFDYKADNGSWYIWIGFRVILQ